ncbi:hypothetical protein [Botryobacter ruber]|uniref:hypothetical protein n=1 Tax=Botryobacter ruber TaxID=2171629 RepID=UPI000F651D98|nr:hypothetical protein [Botryobacter ruber]
MSNLQAQHTVLLNQNSDLQALIASKVYEVQNTTTSNHQQPTSAYSTSLTSTGFIMETQIDGEFEGWEGETIFKMMNGTVWQQASYSYTYHYAYMPSVLIYKKGSIYYMKVDGIDDEIAVRQLR